MLQEDEIISMGYDLSSHIYKASDEIMAEMVNAYKALEDVKPEDITKLLEMGYKDFEVERILSDALSLTMEDYRKMLETIGEAEYNQYAYIFNQAGVSFEKYKDNPVVRQMINSIFQQTEGSMNNFTQTTGFISGIDGHFSPITDYWQEKMNQATIQIMGGTFDYTTSLRKMIVEMKNSGIRIVDYESGWHNRIEVATRRAVMTGINQLLEDITNHNAERLGTDLFEVSAHNGARPTHAVWQGQVYTKKELETVCGLGTGAGLKGWNCYHSYQPFIKGLSKRAYTDEQLKKWRYPEKTSYNGKEYTEYEARQEMRKMETKMRAQRLKIYLEKQAGFSNDYMKTDRIKYRQQLAQYKAFAKFFGLHLQLERVSGLDGLGRLA